MQRFRGILERFLLLWLCGSSIAFLVWALQDSGAASTLKLFKEWTMTPSIMLAMFSVGFLLPVDELKQVVHHWPNVLLGTLTQYATMPLLAWLVASLFGFEGPFLVGVVLVGCVPGAMASNILTLTARGNVSYSICVTTVSTLLSPIMVPLLLNIILGVEHGPDPVGVFLNLLQTVALPVIFGFSLKFYFQLERSAWETIAAITANLAILWIIAVAIGLNAQRLQNVTGTLLLGLFLLNVTGYLAGWGSSMLQRLDQARTKALVLEVGMQNAGVGTILALTFFEETATAIAPAVYTFGCMFTGTILANIWYWRSHFQQQNTVPGDDQTWSMNITD